MWGGDVWMLQYRGVKDRLWNISQEVEADSRSTWDSRSVVWSSVDNKWSFLEGMWRVGVGVFMIYDNVVMDVWVLSVLGKIRICNEDIRDKVRVDFCEGSDVRSKTEMVWIYEEEMCGCFSMKVWKIDYEDVGDKVRVGVGGFTIYEDVDNGCLIVLREIGVKTRIFSIMWELNFAEDKMWEIRL